MHKYRKLYRDDPLRFSTENQNFTDSRLKFRRNFLYVLKKVFLLGDNEKMLKIVEHVIKTNVTRNWDIL